MSRVFWDTMLFVYLLEGNPQFVGEVGNLLKRSYERQDILLTSYLSMGELSVGREPREKPGLILSTIKDMGFQFVEFGAASLEPFVHLRRGAKLRAPDAINLACASSAKTDIFLTGDGEIVRKRVHVPGIHFIVDFRNAPL